MYSDTDNGILARIPGSYVSAAQHTLPPADLAKVDMLETELDVPGIGRVRFTISRRSSRKGKSRNWFWATERAVLVTSP